ncbi:MAG: extracellular solute-binding protein [Spirochaetales bacterium]|nr:extracellular solute-binding protein [Spirochaetales bacterium]
MKSKGFIKSVLLVAVLAMAVLANVGATGQQEAGGEKQETLSFITWRGDDSAAYDLIIENFEAANPNIKVNVEYFKGGTTYDGIVTTRGMGGELDFYAAQPGGQLAAYVQSNFALDVTDQPFVDRVLPGAKAAATYDGVTYGVSQATSTMCVFYNKEIFAEYNLEIPTTWDEFIAICDTLQSNGVTPLVAGLSQHYIAQNFYKMMAAHWKPEESPDYWQNITLKKMTLADEPMPTIMRDIEFLYDQGYYVSGVEGVDKHGAAALFAQGKVAMNVEGAWRTNTIASTEGAPEFGLFALPYKGDADKTVRIVHPNQAHLIFPQSKNIEPSLKFYDHLMNKESQSIYANVANMVPTVKDTPVESPVIKMVMDFLASGEGVLGPNLANTNNEVQQTLYETFTKVAIGLDTDDVIAEMQTKIDGIER